MSAKEYSEELYNAVDNIREAFWLDDVMDDIETVMWYAGLSDDFRLADYGDLEELIKKAQKILNIDLGRWIFDILLTNKKYCGRIIKDGWFDGSIGYTK